MEIPDFYSLPRRARIERCRRLALSSLQEWGLEPKKLRLIPALHPNFQVEDAAGRCYLLKLRFSLEPPVEHGQEIEPWYHYHVCTIDQRLEWQEALSAQTDLQLQIPMRTADDELIQYVTLAGCPDPIPITLSTWLPGRILGKRQIVDHG